MPWHHIIPKHKWKFRFGDLGGVNAHDNLVNLTTEQHSQVHRMMGECGSQYDYIAYLAISRQIGKEEIQKRISSHASSVANAGNKYALGTKRTEEQKNRMVELARGRRQTGKQKLESAKRMIGNKYSLNKKNGLGYKHTEKYKKEASERLIGNTNALGAKHTDEMNRLKSERLIGKKRGPYRRIHIPVV
jgi:hypothetical protein